LRRRRTAPASKAVHCGGRDPADRLDFFFMVRFLVRSVVTVNAFALI
jgi:hypothetical protein